VKKTDTYSPCHLPTESHLTDEDTDEEDPFGLINGEMQPPEWRTAFTDIIESPEKRLCMEPFLDTPLDDEEEFLSSLREEEEEKEKGNLDRISKKMLVKYFGTDFLKDLDLHISSFAKMVNSTTPSTS
jgi:hypothetical protein